MRTTNSIRNIVFGLGSQFTSIIISFITRTVFIYSLGGNYLGVEGLFTNVLSLLSLANLGFDTAIIYSLYKPLSNNNKSEIKGYMEFYSKVYKIIGIAVLCIGLLLIPFLPHLINGEVDIKENITLIYIMFLLSSVASYFYVYKQSILQANQQSYIISKVHTVFIIVSNIVQIIIIVLFKQYLALLVIQLILRLIENIYISRVTDKKFPFLNDKNIKAELTEEKKSKLYKDVYSMFLYKISGTIINSTDNLVISSFIGILAVGVYSNYLLIVSTLNTLLSYIFSSLTASVGNLVASNEEEKAEFIFYEIFFLSFWFYGLSSICLYVLFNDFIMIWLGNDYLLDMFTVSIIVINFYTSGMQNASTTYRNTTGLFSVGKYRPIIAAIINIGASILLVPRLGIAGVLLGTVISRISVYFWFDPYVIHKYTFKSNTKKYFCKYIYYTTIFIGITIITNSLTNLIYFNNIYTNFMLKILICVTVPNLIIILIFNKNKYYIYILNLYKSLSNIKQNSRECKV
ncbi:MAG: oligosaccharide flippase family protein [Romboutsia sp.]